MRGETVRIGYLPTKRDTFNHPDAYAIEKEIRAAIEQWKIPNVEIVYPGNATATGLLETEKDSLGIIEKYGREKVDGLFVPHCNFGSEASVALVAMRLRKPVLVWGPRDEDPGKQLDLSVSTNGRTRDSQCGTFATGKVLRRVNVPFTYVPNTTLESGIVRRSFEAFARVCAAVKAFKETKILQISNRPDQFWTVICNEGELLERFGIRVFPITLIDLQEAVKEVLDKPSSEIGGVVEMIRGATPPLDIQDKHLRQMAAYYLALQTLCRRHNCNSVATTCWNAFRKALGISACAVNGYVTQTGIPVVCEADIHGAITSRLIQAANLYAEPLFFADITVRHPSNENAELLWHCGNFPPALADESCGCTLRNSLSGGVECPGKGFFPLREGPATVCRFDGDHGEYSLLLGEGKCIRGPETSGTYAWFEVRDWIRWEERVVTGPYIHHVAGSYGNLAHVLHETCKYIGVTPDTVESEQQESIAEFWRGR